MPFFNVEATVIRRETLTFSVEAKDLYEAFDHAMNDERIKDCSDANLSIQQMSSDQPRSATT